jgi:hypothetical protein
VTVFRWVLGAILFSFGLFHLFAHERLAARHAQRNTGRGLSVRQYQVLGVLYIFLAAVEVGLTFV